MTIQNIIDILKSGIESGKIKQRSFKEYGYTFKDIRFNFVGGIDYAYCPICAVYKLQNNKHVSNIEAFDLAPEMGLTEKDTRSIVGQADGLKVGPLTKAFPIPVDAS